MTSAPQIPSGFSLDAEPLPNIVVPPTSSSGISLNEAPVIPPNFSLETVNSSAPVEGIIDSIRDGLSTIPELSVAGAAMAIGGHMAYRLYRDVRTEKALGKHWIDDATWKLILKSIKHAGGNALVAGGIVGLGSLTVGASIPFLTTYTALSVANTLLLGHKRRVERKTSVLKKKKSPRLWNLEGFTINVLEQPAQQKIQGLIDFANNTQYSEEQRAPVFKKIKEYIPLRPEVVLGDIPDLEDLLIQSCDECQKFKRTSLKKQNDTVKGRWDNTTVKRILASAKQLASITTISGTFNGNLDDMVDGSNGSERWDEVPKLRNAISTTDTFRDFLVYDFWNDATLSEMQEVFRETDTSKRCEDNFQELLNIATGNLTYYQSIIAPKLSTPATSGSNPAKEAAAKAAADRAALSGASDADIGRAAETASNAVSGSGSVIVNEQSIRDSFSSRPKELYNLLTTTDQGAFMVNIQPSNADDVREELEKTSGKELLNALEKIDVSNSTTRANEAVVQFSSTKRDFILKSAQTNVAQVPQFSRDPQNRIISASLSEDLRKHYENPDEKEKDWKERFKEEGIGALLGKAAVIKEGADIMGITPKIRAMFSRSRPNNTNQ